MTKSPSTLRLFRVGLLTTVGAAFFTASTVGHAQAPQVPSPAKPSRQDKAKARSADSGEIFVTGTRIVRNGYNAPVPVTVLGSEEIAAQKPANIGDFVNTLPSIGVGSTGANSASFISAGVAGVQTVDLRGLGPSRTLVLIDSQRSVGSTAAHEVDVNTIPQDLVERVEVVTGGASAQYGSNAIGGVVNFILDHKFKGVKLSADTGISTYGDGFNYRFGATAGLSFLNDRLHLLTSAEYYHQNGISFNDRSWNKHGFFIIPNPNYTTSSGAPQFYVGEGIGSGLFTQGGLIQSGPLRGIYFLSPGTTGLLNFGLFNSTSSPWMIGGDWQTTLDGRAGTAGLTPTEERISVFNRISFDVNDQLTLYGQFSWNRYHGKGLYEPTESTFTLPSDNAYLQSLYPQVIAAMAANGQTSIKVGSYNPGFPIPGTDNTRQVYRYVAGAKGKFTFLNGDWNWNAYFQHGVTDVHLIATGDFINSRVALAQDAVFVTAANVGSSGLPIGSIACRSTLTDPTNGCVPLNRIAGGASAAALNYIKAGTDPFVDQHYKQDVGAVNLSGEVARLPGGPASIAFGGEWRREQLSTDPINPLFTSGWFVGNYFRNQGSYNVKEGFAELDLPLVKGLDLNAAGRIADFSTSGTVKAWKISSNYSPVPDIKFRASYSHDFRAPNLQELYFQKLSSSINVNFPANPNNMPVPGLYPVVTRNVGNLGLKPEQANTLTAGFVVTPQFIPGFQASFDYYDIKIKDVIGTLSAQQTVDYCYQGISPTACNNIVFAGAVPSQLILRPINFASQHEKGFDIAASYRTPLANIAQSLPGTFSIHADVTHYIQNVVNNGVLSIDYAGVNGGPLQYPASAPIGSFAVPNWVYRVSAFYNVDPLTFNLVAHGFSAGVYGNNYIQCTSGCPTSSAANPTINNNHIPGAFYLDGSVALKLHPWNHEATITLVVHNILNKNPPLIGNITSDFINAFPQTNFSSYDVIGRTFRIAAAVKF